MLNTLIIMLCAATTLPILSAQNNAHTSMCFSHNREFLARGLANKICVVSNVRYEVDPTYLNHKAKAAALESLAFSPNDNFIASGDSTGVIRIWNSNSTQKVYSSHKLFNRRSRSSIKFVRFVGNYLLTLAKNKPGKAPVVKDCTTGKTVCKSSHKPHVITGIESSSPHIIMFSDQQRPYVWDIRTNKHIPGRTNKFTLVETIGCHPTLPLVAVGYTPTCDGYEKIRIWNYAENKMLSCHSHKSRTDDGITHITFDPQKYEYAFCADHKVIVVNAAVGTEKYHSKRSFEVPALALTHNDETILMGMKNGEIVRLMNRYKEL
ncbi:hypothetical protein Noda2021_00030 [Candidatus Dependentiae bacterium Noda2021]|nr:hypothetical protein Noda2021_00030 [Candidatus Dependentiae bacterium Noda2021]